jgi:hypothetical protein
MYWHIGKQQLEPTVGVDEDEEMKEQDVAKEIVKRQRNNRNNSKKLSYNIGTRKDKTRSNEGMKEDGRNEGNKETTATNEQEGNGN